MQHRKRGIPGGGAEGRLDEPGGQWGSQQEWPPIGVEGSGTDGNGRKGERADRPPDGRILWREDLEKGVGRKLSIKYLENEVMGMLGWDRVSRNADL